MRTSNTDSDSLRSKCIFSILLIMSAVAISDNQARPRPLLFSHIFAVMQVSIRVCSDFDLGLEKQLANLQRYRKQYIWSTCRSRSCKLPECLVVFRMIITGVLAYAMRFYSDMILTYGCTLITYRSWVPVKQVTRLKHSGSIS